MRPEKVWHIFIFPNIDQNLLTLMHLRTYRSFCGGPAVDACVRAYAAARRKQYELLYRHFRTESKYVRITADALTAANRHARHGQRVR